MGFRLEGLWVRVYRVYIGFIGIYTPMGSIPHMRWQESRLIHPLAASRVYVTKS